MPNSEPTRRNWVEKKETRSRPVGVIGSGGSKHQRVAGGSIGFGTTRKRWKKHKSDENLTGFDEILPDPVKISSNLREIAPESRKISPGFGFFHQFLENFSRNLEIFWSVQVFQVLREKNRNPTCRNRFLVMKTRRRPAGVVRSANFRSDLVGSSSGSGTRMNLDSPKNNT